MLAWRDDGQEAVKGEFPDTLWPSGSTTSRRRAAQSCPARPPQETFQAFLGVWPPEK